MTTVAPGHYNQQKLVYDLQLGTQKLKDLGVFKKVLVTLDWDDSDNVEQTGPFLKVELEEKGRLSGQVGFSTTTNSEMGFNVKAGISNPFGYLEKLTANFAYQPRRSIAYEVESD